MAKLAYAYTRVSTERQALKGGSLAAQEAQIEKYFKLMLEPEGYTWGGLFRDAATSGQRPLLKRPGGQKLSAKLEPGDIVIISRLDRGFRNLRDLLTTIDTWKIRSISLHLLDIKVDTGTPMGRFMISVLGSVAEFEAAWRNERVRMVCDDLTAKGYYAKSGKFPYGFKTKGPRCRRKLVRDDEWRAFGAMLLEWRRQGWTIERIWKHMRKHDIRYRGTVRGMHAISSWTEAEAWLQAQEAKGIITPEPYRVWLIRKARAAARRASRASPPPSRPSSLTA